MEDRSTSDEESPGTRAAVAQASSTPQLADQVDSPSQSPGTGPYEVIAYSCLGAVFLVQLVEGSPLGGLLAFGCGVLAMVGKLQMGPIFYIVLVAGNLLANFNQGIDRRNFFRPAWLDVSDVIACIGVLGFVACHYRLQGVWFHQLARDVRRRPAKPHLSFRLSLGRLGAQPDPGRRVPEQISMSEVSWLIVTLPVWAIFAQFATYSISRIRVAQIDLWLVRILTVAWVLGLGTFVMVHLLEAWKRYSMNRAGAWLFLQDTFWRETRGEQRQMQRWLAWKRLRRR